MGKVGKVIFKEIHLRGFFSTDIAIEMPLKPKAIGSLSAHLGYFLVYILGQSWWTGSVPGGVLVWCTWEQRGVESLKYM